MNNIKNLEWKKYFYKNLLICSLVIFFIFSVITIALTSGYSRAVNNETNRYCLEVSFNIKYQINKILEAFTESYNELITDYNSDVSIATHSEDITTKIGSDAIHNIKDALKPYKSGIGSVDSIYIFIYPRVNISYLIVRIFREISGIILQIHNG